MTPFDMWIALGLAVAALVVAVAAWADTHGWKRLIEDHARRIDALEKRGKQPDRAAMVD